MSISVSLWSRKEGEIKRFLQKFYGKEVYMDEDVNRWIYVFKKPLDSVDMISAVMDNNDKFQISICVQVGEGNLHMVTAENHNEIIRDMFELFYQEPAEAVYCE